ncbi:hypothetical protein ACHAO4_009645 [Trichoderma viride]
MRLAITTSDLDDFVQRSVPESRVVSLNNCPEPLSLYSVDEQGIDACGLEPSLELLLRKRPVLKHIEAELNNVMTECQSSPHLGFRIMDWLSNFRRGLPLADLTLAIKELHPVTPDSVLSVFVGSLPHTERKLAILIHRWVKYALEPLTIEALGHAIAASAPDNTSILDFDYTQLSSDINRLFSGIVTIQGRDIKFSHDSFYSTTLSTQDEGDDEQPADVHGLMAVACLRYMMHEEVQQLYSELLADNYGGNIYKGSLFHPREDLLAYAIRFWAEHYRLAGAHPPLELALGFLRSDTKRRRWAEAYYVLSNPFTHINRSYFSPLPAIAALGLEDVIIRQVEDDQGSQHFLQDVWLAISEAARNGHLQILRRLLDLVEAEEYGLHDAIFWAISSGNDEIIHALLDKVRSLDTFSWPKSIFSRAAAAGVEELVSAFSEAGANLNVIDDDIGEAPIHTAIFWGQSSVVKILLDAGIDLTVKELELSSRTPLLLSAHMGHPEIVQMLLDAKANIEEKDAREASVLSTAIASGQHAALKPILAAGAEVATGIAGGDIPELQPPIIHAAEYDRVQAMRLLIEQGVDLETESKDGTALYISCRDPPTIEVCRMLLEKGANPNLVYPDKEMLLNRALRTNDKELISLLLEKGAKLDLADIWEDTTLKTPLAFAASESNFEIFEFLVEKGASVNLVPEGAESALFASSFRNTEVKKTELLLQKGADIHWKRDDGWTPFHAAYDMPAMISLFLEHGADINSMCDCGTVLMMAARWNFKETIKILLAYHPPADIGLRFTYDPDDEDYNGTALLFALKKSSYECATMLLEAGAPLDGNLEDPKFILQLLTNEKPDDSYKLMKCFLDHGVKSDYIDENRNTALHGISQSTGLSLVQLLMDSGAPIDTPNAGGLTPLAIAVETKNIAAARFLISKGAQANVYNPSFGSLLHLACKNRAWEYKKRLELVKLLVEAKVDPNVPGPDPERESLLHRVIRTSNTERVRHKLVQYLVEEAHANINMQGGLRGYPIIIAAQSLDRRLIQYLIRHGADVGIFDSQGRHASHYIAALMTWDSGIFKLLVNAGADLQAPDNLGRTPLHLAAGYGYLNGVEALLKRLPKNTDINVRDRDGWTPLMWSCKFDMRNSPVANQLVQKYGADIWAKSNDGKWSALKIACFSGWSDFTRELLQPPEDKRERIGTNGVKEVWNPDFHITEIGKAAHGTRCSSCLLAFSGPRYKCFECDEFIYLCFKCFPYRKSIHDADHEFKEEIEEVPGNSHARSAQSQASDEVANVSVHSGSHTSWETRSKAAETGTDSDDDDDDDNDNDESEEEDSD